VRFQHFKSVLRLPGLAPPHSATPWFPILWFCHPTLMARNLAGLATACFRAELLVMLIARIGDKPFSAANAFAVMTFHIKHTTARPYSAAIWKFNAHVRRKK
jgi:hypothetical protein